MQRDTSIYDGIKKSMEIFDIALEQNAIKDFKNFLLLNKNIEEWGMSSDYSLNGDVKVLSFCVFPANNIDKLQNEIKLNIPSDIKNTTHFQEKTITYLKNNTKFFNFVFIIKDDYSIDYYTIYKQAIDLIKKLNINGNQIGETYKKRLSKLKKISTDKKLFPNIYIISVLASYLMSWILRYTKTCKKNIWIPDRGPSFSFAENLLCDLYSYEFTILKNIYNVMPQKFNIITETNHLSNKYEFDELIKIPDYLSGIIAAFDGKDDNIDDRFFPLFQKIFINNNNISLIDLEISEGNTNIKSYNLKNGIKIQV